MPSLPDVMAPFPSPVASRFDAGFRCQDQHLPIGIVPAWQAELVLWHWQVQPQLGNRSEPRFGHLTFHRQWIRPGIWPQQFGVQIVDLPASHRPWRSRLAGGSAAGHHLVPAT